MKERLPKNITRKLGYYVYLYINPISKTVFYIGKGKGNRAYSRLEDRKSRVGREVKKIRQQGGEPQVQFLRYNLSSKDALLIESAAIDLLELANLTNSVRGHGSRKSKRATAAAIAHLLSDREATISEPSILINVARKFQEGLSSEKLYDVTRSAWKVNPNIAKRAELAFCIYQGSIREVYRIADWLPWGSTLQAGDTEGSRPVRDKRWEFVGRIAEDKLRAQYLGQTVTRYLKQGSQNPIKYINLSDKAKKVKTSN